MFGHHADTLLRLHATATGAASRRQEEEFMVTKPGTAIHLRSFGAARPASDADLAA